MTQPITILGAGAVGLCTALSLAERGQPVRLIDRGDPGQETSFGNAGVISPWSIIPQSMPGIWKKIPSLMFGPQRPLSVRAAYWPKMIPWGLSFLRNGTTQRVQDIAGAMEPLCAPSIDLYRRHLQGTGQEHLVQDSAYVHAFRSENPDALQGLDYRIRAEKGADLELVGADELSRIEPALSREFKAAVLVHGQARALSPGKIMTVLAEKAKTLGVEILRDDIQSLRRVTEGWEVLCSNASYRCNKVILAMGAWSAELVNPLGISVPLAVERGYHVEFPAAGVELQNSVMDVDAKFVASSMEDGLRVAGQAEFAAIDAREDPSKKSRMMAQAKAAFPDLNTIETRFWMGRRPSFPDSLPMIGEFDALPGLFAGFGHSHYGLMMAPKTGELLAEMLTDTSPNIDCRPYRTNRFTRAK
ncbi:FAD-binding oxidoreductase [Aliiroseovarius sp. PrR006]|uniref:NAD(P)/FAD-dependent oxidoreductase n=1 Tax=Aliiroseovarius sp. PrR006 TaxID=2706883 RepID=UPI0013D8BB60|nr:FAD-dependent oxidoreductase [Aliiroseovarius sp. PrR006]NDW53803.1 FAD-binding oxidoreductase [Aliiroseovarius sp. PrR006]